jgi:hypothetical protein
MRFKPPKCKRLQGAADARRRARRRSFVLQVPDNKADAVPCERLPCFDNFTEKDHRVRRFTMSAESLTTMHIWPEDILEQIKKGRGAWETSVPEVVAEEITNRGLFGFDTM